MQILASARLACQLFYVANDDNDLNQPTEEPEFRDMRADFLDDFEDGNDSTDNSSAHGGTLSTNRTLLQALVAVLVVAIGLAVWVLSSNNRSNSANSQAGPTAVTVPTSTPTPTYREPTPTPEPTPIPTPLPEGFRACDATQLPNVDASYVVDTNTTPLKQRRAPSIQADQAGNYPPATKNLRFTGECVVNVGDGLTWWSIDNGEEVVWVAAKFVTQG